MRTGVHQHEAAGAVGVFGHTGAKAGLAEQSALLVPCHAAYGNAVAQEAWLDLAKVRSRGQHLGHQALGDVEGLQQLRVPGVAVHIKEHGARRVAHIGGVYAPIRQLPQEPAVHRAKGQFAVRCLGAGVRHVIQNPLQLGARKISIH